MRPARLLPGQRFGQPPEPTATAGVVSALASFIRGCVASNNGTDAAHDLDISAGGATMVSGNYTVALTAMTKQFDTVWAGGTNQGGSLNSASLTGKVCTAGASTTILAKTKAIAAAVNGAAYSEETAGTTVHDVAVPSEIIAGELLMAFVTIDQQQHPTGGWSGWTLGASEDRGPATGVTSEIYYKPATGSETAFTFSTSGSVVSNSYVLRIGGWSGTPVFGTAEGASSTPNPPSVNSGLDASYQKRWIVFASSDAPGNFTVYPTGFADNQYTDNNGGTSMALATKVDTTQTLDPATFTSSVSDDWIAHTVSIQPSDDVGAFTTEYAVGDLIYFGTSATPRRVTAVTDNNTLTVSESISISQGLAENHHRRGGLGDANSDGGTVHMFALYDPVLDTIDYGMSRRAATPVDLPIGFTEYRRIGSFRPDANDDMPVMSCMELAGGGVEVLYTTPIEDVDVTDLGAASTTYTLSVPSGHKHHAMIHATVEHASARARVNIRPLDVTDQAPSQTASPLSTLISQVNAVDAAAGRMQIRTNTSGQIAARSDQANTLFGVATLGYIDHRRAV